MKSRRNRRKISKTRKQRGGVVFSKIKRSNTVGSGSSSSSSLSSSLSSQERINSRNLNYGAVNGEPVIFEMFIVSPEIGNQYVSGSYGPQYSKLEEELMNQILTLRQEAFPEVYTKKTIDSSEIWIAPMHCDAEPGTLSRKNFMYTLFYYTDSSEEQYKENIEWSKTSVGLGQWVQQIVEMPTLISNCSLSICDLKGKKGKLRIAELVGVATFAEYQKQNFGTKLLVGVLNSISDKNTNVDYVWLYYDRTKPYLKDFYEQFGFKEITEKEKDPELKKIYIGKEVLYNRAKKDKKEEFFYKTEKKYQKNTGSGMNLDFVNEEEFDSWAKQKREQVYDEYVSKDKRTGKPFTNKNGKNAKDSLTEKSIQDFGGDLEKYKQAMFDVWITKDVNKPFIITKAINDELNTLTENEKIDALEFERENAQMVLSIADWVYTVKN